jgi:DNA-damage-inducible protein J
MATIQVRIDDKTKEAADSLFTSLGLDTSTAVRIFLIKALKHNGIPFAVQLGAPNVELSEAIEDSRLRRNLTGPFDTVDEAMEALSED